MTLRDPADGRIKGIFGYDLAQNLAAFLLQRKLIISFHLGPASDALGRRPRAGLVGEEMLSENAGVGGPSLFAIFYFSLSLYA